MERHIYLLLVVLQMEQTWKEAILFKVKKKSLVEHPM
jgi:hypothetical protein